MINFRRVIVLAFLCIGAPQASAQAPHWIKFRDAETGLSFRYPPELRVRELDPGKFHLPNLEKVVELIGDTKLNPGTIVLRFLVKRGRTTPRTAASEFNRLRQVCRSASSINVGGHQAAVCVSCGRGAFHWQVEVLQPRQCTIVTLLGGADAQQALPPPHDGRFPLLSIIKTVYFAPPESSQH
jgi:hypothetical protein